MLPNDPTGSVNAGTASSPQQDPDNSPQVVLFGDGAEDATLQSPVNAPPSADTPAGPSVSGNTSAFVINVSYDASVVNAPAAFKTAVANVVQFYENLISTPITVNIQVGFGEVNNQALQANALGESETFLQSFSYSSIKTALANVNPSAANSLPATGPGTMWLATSDARALGLSSTSGIVDGYAGFSNIANIFDYDNSNGVTPGQYDFNGVVAHEFSEILGRIDLMGVNIGGTPNSFDLLDMYHYTAPGTHTFTGTTANYFSVNGGTTNLDNFNTNPNGDLGDWAASAGNDSYDAFSNSGVTNVVSQADITVMNALGYTLANLAQIRVIQVDGSTSLDQIGSNYFLDLVGGSSGPSVKFSGVTVVAGQFGGAWAPIGAVQTTSGYDIAWKNGNADAYTLWITDSSGNYVSDSIGIVTGNSATLELAEAIFNQDLNGDGTIGASTRVIQIDGSTKLVEVGSTYFLDLVGGPTGPSLKFSGADVVAGQFGGAWAPIGAVQTTSGYDIAWKNGNADAYTIWVTDSSGNYVSDTIGIVTGNSAALESAESVFNQDINGDGVIGLPTRVIQVDGSTSLDQIGNNYFLVPVGGSFGPSLKFSGADVVAAQFGGAWAPIGAVQTTSGYDIAWKNGNADAYTIWMTDGNGTYVSDSIGIVTGNSAALKSAESIFNQDFNGNGVIGAATTNPMSADGALVVDQSAGFTGRIVGLEGQDQTDLRDIGFGVQTTLAYAPNGDGTDGAPNVGDGTHSANLALLGNYMAGSFATSSDGHGGTLVSEQAQTAGGAFLGAPVTTHTG